MDESIAIPPNEDVVIPGTGLTVQFLGQPNSASAQVMSDGAVELSAIGGGFWYVKKGGDGG